MKYVVDTSAILAGSKFEPYEKEFFAPYWEKFEEKIKKGTIVSTDLVYKEIKEKDDIMTEWADNNNEMFKTPSNNVLQTVSNLHRRFPIWYQFNVENKKIWADAQVIAFAKYYKIVLVTQEAWNKESEKEQNFRIPTICSRSGALCHIKNQVDHGIKNHNGFQCIDFLELIKREGLNR